MTPDTYCREKAARPGSTTYYSTLFAPAGRRRGLIALSAFCREITDVTRKSADLGVARTKLAWWRAEVANLYRGQPRHPVCVALSDFIGPHELQIETFETLIDGAEMDLDYNAYPDFDALAVYCRRIGGSLAKLWAQVSGYQDAQTIDAATDLGIALQLTRIVRNVGNDVRRNRIYLPLHDLAQHGVTSDALVKGEENESFAKLMAFEVKRVEALYETALAGLPQVDRKSQRALIAAAAINRSLLREIRRDGYRVLSGRTSLTPLRKLVLAWRA